MITAPNGGFAIESTQSEVCAIGFFHISTAFFGNTLLRKNKAEAPRNAMIWPVPYQNLWLTATALSEWSRGSDALVKMTSVPMMLFTAITLAIALWQTSESFANSDDHPLIPFKSRLTNTAVTFSTYTGFLVAFSSLALGICVADIVSPGHGKEFITSLVDAHPAYGFFVSNVFMNFAWANNLAVLLATLLKYKVVNRRQLQFVYLSVTILVLQGIITCLLITDVEPANELFLNGLISSLTGDFTL